MATVSDALAVSVTVPESVDPEAGEVMETLSEDALFKVANVASLLAAAVPFPSVERTWKWYVVPAVRFVSVA